jgi:cholesterol oxidase
VTAAPTSQESKGRSVHFTEEMAGYLCVGAPDYAAGWHNGKAAVEGMAADGATGTKLLFHLTIGTHDLDAFLADPQHLCQAVGYISAPLFGGDHLPVVRGRFNLFAPGLSPGRTVMRYRLWFTTASGDPLTLIGFKDVGNDPGIDSWRDTTCLFTRVVEGHVEPDEDEAATERARGLIVIEPAMFARQLTTFRGHPAAVLRFGWMFARSLAKIYWSRPRPRRPR